MSFEKSIKKAIEYEKNIQDLYEEIAERSESALARMFFARMAEEEGRHVQFFHRKLKEWLSTGQATYEKLAVPFDSKQAVAVEVEDVSELARLRQSGTLSPAVRTLLKALELEEKATLFYREAAERLEGEKRNLFSQFIKIETAHENVIKEKMKHLIETGKWSD